MKYKKIVTSPFVRNVVTLTVGTSIAQAIPLAVTPILTRLYSPEDFGVLALFLSITAIGSVLVTGRYDLAITLPKSNKQALHIVYLSILLSFVVSSLFFIIVFIFNAQITSLLNEPRIRMWLYLTPLTVFLIGVYNTLHMYKVRQQQYTNMAVATITKFSSLTLVQVGVGFLKAGAVGLLLGQLISYITGLVVLLKGFSNTKQYLRAFNKRKLLQVAKRYKRFPKLALPGSVLNSISLNALNFMIASLFSTFILGQYALASRILGIPSRVMGSSISQVYFQKLSETKNKGLNTKKLFRAMTVRLFLIAIPVFTVAYFLVEPLFGFVFGNQWIIAGTYAKILTPLLAIRFVSSTLSPTLYVFERQDLTLITQIVLAGTLLGLFIMIQVLKLDFITTLQWYTWLYFVAYGAFIILYKNVVSTHQNPK